MKIKEVTGKRTPTEIVEFLKQKSIEVPSWENLKKEYDPREHPVMNKKEYPDKVTKKGIERVTRIALGLQKLAANRMTQLTFGIAVKRIYKYDRKDKEQDRAAKILEDIYNRNRIDSINMQRGLMLFAGCEVATLWYGVEADNYYYNDEESLIKIRCKNFSPMDDDSVSFAQTASLYPSFDDYDDMVAMSFAYSRKIGDNTVNYFDVYTDEEHIRYSDESGEWKEDTQVEVIGINKIPVSYTYRPTPIWEHQSENVYEAEWQLSLNGNYLRKNQKPIFAVYSDDKVKFGEEKDEKSEFRTVVQYGKEARAEYVTWEQAIESLKFQIEQIKQNFFTELQLPDISYESMKSTPMSGESRKIMFTDAHLKVTQESGIIVEFLDRETNIIKALAKKAFPKLEKAFDTLRVEQLITPFFINDEDTRTETLVTATGGKAIKSRLQAIKELGAVDDAEAELTQIQNEEMHELSESTDVM